MLENLFTNVFGRPKNKSGNRNSQHDPSSGAPPDQSSGPGSMTGPFSMSAPQMPQPPGQLYPVPSPYPANPAAAHSTMPEAPGAYYPQLPFSHPPSMPQPYGGSQMPGGSQQPNTYPTGTIAASQTSPLDSVPFEAQFSLNNSSNLVSLDQLFKEIKKAGDVVERADAYLRSNQSDYDFKVEQGLIYH